MTDLYVAGYDARYADKPRNPCFAREWLDVWDPIAAMNEFLVWIEQYPEKELDEWLAANSLRCDVAGEEWLAGWDAADVRLAGITEAAP